MTILARLMPDNCRMFDTTIQLEHHIVQRSGMLSGVLMAKV
jgi:hypothetical protein